VDTLSAEVVDLGLAREQNQGADDPLVKRLDLQRIRRVHEAPSRFDDRSLLEGADSNFEHTRPECRDGSRYDPKRSEQGHERHGLDNVGKVFNHFN
jgi:hypothetical protein